MRISTVYSLLLTVTLALFVTSCKKDARPVGPDDGEDTYTGPSTDVSPLEYVTVLIPGGTALSENEYAATLGETEVTLIRQDEHTLAFLVPPDAKPGKNKLVIAGLENQELHYTITEKKLDATPETVIRPLLEKLSVLKTALSDSPEDANLKLNITNFELLITESSPEERKQFALFYELNSDMLNNLIDYRFTASEEGLPVAQLKTGVGRFSNTTYAFEDDDLIGLHPRVHLRKFCGYVLTFAIANFGFINSIKAFASSRSAGEVIFWGAATFLTGIVAANSLVEAANHFYQFLKIKLAALEHDIDEFGQLDYPYGTLYEFDDTQSVYHRYNQPNPTMGIAATAGSIQAVTGDAPPKPLLILANQPNKYTFSRKMRAVIEDDRHSDSPLLNEFFEAYDKYNEMASDINEYIAFVNKKVSLANLSPLQTLYIPSVPTFENVPIDAASLSTYTFTLDHPSLSLVGVVLNHENQLLLQINIDESDWTPRITSELTYEYTDPLDETPQQGSIPIIVDQGPLVGTWSLESSELSWSYWSGKEEDKPSRPKPDLFESYLFEGDLRFTPIEMHFENLGNTGDHMYYQSYQLVGNDIAVNDGYVFTMGKDGSEMKYLSDGRIRIRKEYTLFEDEAMTVRVYSFIHETFYKKDSR